MLEQIISNDYLRSGAILIIVFIILRVLILIIEKVILKLTLKTKTDLDDILLEKSSKPITFVALIIGLRIALTELPLNESLESTIYKIVASLIILTIAYLTFVIIDVVILRAWKKFAKKTKSDIDDSLVNLIHGVLKITWTVASLLYLLDFWGIKVGPFLAGLGIAGLAIAFALQASLSNIFGGISMILDRSVRVGDLVYLDDGLTKGKILHVGLRSTRIQTFDNELIIVPNGKLADSKIQNIALPEPKVRVVIPFGVAYGSDIEKVKKLILNEIKKIKGVLTNPEPHVKFLEMADSSLNFNAYFYLDTFEDRLSAKDEANTKIYNALNKARIEIPFPQRDIHIRKE